MCREIKGRDSPGLGASFTRKWQSSNNDAHSLGCGRVFANIYKGCGKYLRAARGRWDSPLFLQPWTGSNEAAAWETGLQECTRLKRVPNPIVCGPAPEQPQ